MKMFSAAKHVLRFRRVISLPRWPLSETLCRSKGTWPPSQPFRWWWRLPCAEAEDVPLPHHSRWAARCGRARPQNRAYNSATAVKLAVVALCVDARCQQAVALATLAVFSDQCVDYLAHVSDIKSREPTW